MESRHPQLSSFKAIEHDDTDIYRIDLADGRAHTKQSFFTQYGEEEGLRRWQVAPRADGTTVTGLGNTCSSVDCQKEAEVYCHDCKKVFCSYACLTTAHRRTRTYDHNRITYTLAGARRMLESSEMYSPVKPIRPHDDVNARIQELNRNKQAAVAVEDYSAAQRYKDMITSLQTSEQTAHPSQPVYPQQIAGHPAHPGYSSPMMQQRAQSPPPPSFQPPGPWSPHGAWSM